MTADAPDVEPDDVKSDEVAPAAKDEEGLDQIGFTDQPSESTGASAPMISVHGLTKRTGENHAYRDVSFTAGAGELVVLAGPEGTGKTMLLLGILGRMTFDAGGGHVAGFELPRRARRVREHSAVANVDALTALDNSMTVRQHLAERIIMNRPWYLPVASRRAVDRAMDEYLDIAAHLGDRFDALPPAAMERLGLAERPDLELRPDAYIDELNDLQRLTVEIVLACISKAEIVGVDDVDLLRTQKDRLWAWLLLLQLSGLRQGFSVPTTTLIATCQETTELQQLLDAFADEADDFAPVQQVLLPGKET